MNRVPGNDAEGHGIRKYSAQESGRTRRRSPAATHDRPSARSGLDVGLRLSNRYVGQKPVDIRGRDVLDPTRTEKGNDVASDSSSVGGKCRGLLGPSLLAEKKAMLGIGQVALAELFPRHRLAVELSLFGRVRPLGDTPQE